MCSDVGGAARYPFRTWLNTRRRLVSPSTLAGRVTTSTRSDLHRAAGLMLAEAFGNAVEYGASIARSRTPARQPTSSRRRFAQRWQIGCDLFVSDPDQETTSTSTSASRQFHVSPLDAEQSRVDHTKTAPCFHCRRARNPRSRICGCSRERRLTDDDREPSRLAQPSSAVRLASCSMTNSTTSLSAARLARSASRRTRIGRVPGPSNT